MKNSYVKPILNKGDCNLVDDFGKEIIDEDYRIKKQKEQIMKNNIKVKCILEFQLWGEGKTKLMADVKEKEYEAVLFKETEEYFAKDSEGREFLVGELNSVGKLILEQDFQLVTA